MRPVVVKSFLHAISSTLDAPTSVRQATNIDALGDWKLGDVLHARDGVVVRDASPLTAATTEPPRYVVKLLDAKVDDLARMARFCREAAAGRSVSSPHVVAVLAAHLRETPRYFVMPKLAGRSLAELLARRGRLSPASALCVARQSAAGLQAIHAAGWTHADLRPSNIMVSRTGHATLIDLEHAGTADDDSDPIARCIAGTVEYLAPEAACSRHRVDGRSDFYSLGIVLFEMLTGRLPFQGTTPEATINAHLTQEPPYLRELASDLPENVCTLVRTLLHKQPLRRPQSAGELVEALARLEIEHLELRCA
ncbi:MAG: hypothetical protein C0483_15715 [Pirellula sp.]|nr:hypothetical protein [Pirellula sp.]